MVGAAPGVSEAQEPDTRERLLDAAQRLYAARGSRGMTTRAVASEAGVNELTLYRHFTNKRGLLDAMAHRLAEVPFVDRILDAANTGNLREDLLRIALAMRSNTRMMQPFILRALAEAAEHPERLDMAVARPRAAMDRLAEFFQRRMEAGQARQGDALMTAHAFVSLLFSRALLSPLYGHTDGYTEREVLEAFVKIFAEGASAPAPTPAETTEG